MSFELIIVSLAEIDPEVDFDSRRAVYFRQMRYGLYVRFFLSKTFHPILRFCLSWPQLFQIRMALLVSVLG